MAATAAQGMGSLPSGLGICTTAPDIFYLPELVSDQWQENRAADLHLIHEEIFFSILEFFSLNLNG